MEYSGWKLSNLKVKAQEKKDVWEQICSQAQIKGGRKCQVKKKR